MAYNEDQISNIHQRGLGVPRKKYINEKGEVYIGQNNGRLVKRDTGLSALEKKVDTLPSKVSPTSPRVLLGERYKINYGDKKVIESFYDYYVHANFEISPQTNFFIKPNAQLSVGDGKIINKGMLINNGIIIATL